MRSGTVKGSTMAHQEMEYAFSTYSKYSHILEYTPHARIAARIRSFCQP
jgi:hypothetical protein